jgi:hypothetical protein
LTTLNSGQSNARGSTMSHLSLVSQKVNTKSDAQIPQEFGPDIWQVQDVPDRTHILFHVANTSADVVGCIGCGISLYPDLNGVGSSRKAMAKFDSYLAGLDETDLVIKSGALK